MRRLQVQRRTESSKTLLTIYSQVASRSAGRISAGRMGESRLLSRSALALTTKAPAQ
jgi:hypothetical protein